MAGNKAYSAGWIRDVLDDIGIEPVVPRRANETDPPERFPRQRYKGRNVIERCLGH